MCNTHREPNKVLCIELHTTFYATKASKVRIFQFTKRTNSVGLNTTLYR